MLAGVLYLGAGAFSLALVAYHRHAGAAVLSPHAASAKVRSDRFRVLVAALLGGGAGPALYTWGLSHTGAAAGGVLMNTELVATVLLGAALGRERLGARVWFAVALLAASAVIVSGRASGFDAGSIAVVFACVLWAVDNVVTSQIDQYTPAQVMAVKGSSAGTVMVLVSLASGPALSVPLSHMLAAVVLGAAGYGLSPVLWVMSAHKIGAARAQVIFSLGPFFGSAGGWVLLGEEMRLSVLLAFVLAALGARMCLSGKHAHMHLHTFMEHVHAHSHDCEHHRHEHELQVPPPQGASHSHMHLHHAVEHDHPHEEDLHHRH